MDIEYRSARSSASLGRLNSILHHLEANGLWGFPVGADKLPLVPWKQFQTKPPTESETQEWSRRFPNAGAAIPTGKVTGVLVVDADSPDAIEWLEVRGVPETPIVRSPRGLHYYLKYPQGLQVGNSAGQLAQGVDVRGTGGMIIAAGSRRHDGFTYHYEPGHALGAVPIAAPPEWLMHWFMQRQPTSAPTCAPRPFNGRTGAWAKKVIDDELATLRSAVSGSRNDTLTRIAFKFGRLAAGGEADGAELLAVLQAAAESWPGERCKSRDTISRAFAAGEAHPRQAPIRNAVYLVPTTEARQ